MAPGMAMYRRFEWHMATRHCLARRPDSHLNQQTKMQTTIKEHATAMQSTIAKNPWIINAEKDHHGNDSYVRERLKGQFRRVFPHTAADIYRLQMLDHRVEKFAPCEGSGVIVTEQAFIRYLRS